MGVSGSLTSVEFSRVPRLAEFSKFLRHKVDISGNLKLMDLSKFPKF